MPSLPAASWLCCAMLATSLGSAHAQETCLLGKGLVLLNTSPPTDSIRVHNFVSEPEEYVVERRVNADGDSVAWRMPREVARTLLFYQPPGYGTSDSAVVPVEALGGELEPVTFPFFGGPAYTTFSDSVWFSPFAHRPHKSAFGLRWVGERGKWLHVVVHEESDTTLWIRDERYVAAFTWEELYHSSTLVGRAASWIQTENGPRTVFDADGFPVYEQPVRIQPDDAAEAVEAKGEDCFRVEDVQGDWLRVSPLDCRLRVRPVTQATGWIRWCRGDQQLAFPTFDQGYVGLIDERKGGQ